MESIKEAKAICTHSTQEAKRPSVLQPSRKLRPLVPTPSRKPKPFAPRPLGRQRPGEPSQADSLHQWTHTKSIQHLEEQAIQEEGKSQLDFLFACQAAIQASPVELCGTLVASYHILMGQAPMSHPFTLSQGASSTEQVSAPVAPSSLVPEHVHPDPSAATPLPRPGGCHAFWWDHIQGNPGRAP